MKRLIAGFAARLIGVPNGTCSRFFVDLLRVDGLGLASGRVVTFVCSDVSLPTCRPGLIGIAASTHRALSPGLLATARACVPALDVPGRRTEHGCVPRPYAPNRPGLGFQDFEFGVVGTDTALIAGHSRLRRRSSRWFLPIHVRLSCWSAS